MTAPRTVFDRPQSDLLPDRRGARMYANVDNRMEVTARGRSALFPVAVPTMLFTYMAQVARIPAEQEVNLSLELFDDLGYYVFSLLAGDELHDLWYYSLKGVPQWTRNPAYRCADFTRATAPQRSIERR